MSLLGGGVLGVLGTGGVTPSPNYDPSFPNFIDANPSKPATPVFAEEFNGSGLPAGWTEFNFQAGTTFTQANSMGGLASTGDHNGGRDLLEAVVSPVLTGLAEPYTVIARVAATSLQGTGNLPVVGVAFADGFVTCGYQMAGGGWQIITWNPGGTLQALLNNPQLQMAYTWQLYKVVVHSAANLDFAVSQGGAAWSVFPTGVNPGYGADQHQVVLGIDPFGNRGTAEFDWVRVYDGVV